MINSLRNSETCTHENFFTDLTLQNNKWLATTCQNLTKGENEQLNWRSDSNKIKLWITKLETKLKQKTQLI